MGKKIIFSILLLLSFGFSAKAQEYLDSIKSQSTQMVNAFSKGDYGKLLEFTHPSIIKIMGGKETATKLLDTALHQLKESGITVEEAKVGDIIQSLKSNDTIQCMLPQYLKMKMGDKFYSSKNYLFGISYNNGKRWYFIDTNGGTEESIRKMIPEISKEIVFLEAEKSFN